MTHCPKCVKEVNTVWKFSRERCQICGTPLDKNPIKINGFFGFFDRVEHNRKEVESMIAEGQFLKSDFR